jgi:hypothetical protein
MNMVAASAALMAAIVLAMQGDSAVARTHAAKALASRPAGERCPFERAQLQLDYAERMRRRRRINEAKTLLLAAQETFRWLHIARARAEPNGQGHWVR